jgi:putative endonuclease
LYTGVTSKLEQRAWQHKNHVFGGFTDRYNIDRLVYFEVYTTVQRAIAREKEIKGWTRAKKMQLVVSENPAWQDLSEDWGKPIAVAGPGLNA